MTDFKNKNIYDLKNLLFKAVVEKDTQTEKAVKKAIYYRLENVSNFMLNN